MTARLANACKNAVVPLPTTPVKVIHAPKLLSVSTGLTCTTLYSKKLIGFVFVASLEIIKQFSRITLYQIVSQTQKGKYYQTSVELSIY